MKNCLNALLRSKTKIKICVLLTNVKNKNAYNLNTLPLRPQFSFKLCVQNTTRLQSTTVKKLKFSEKSRQNVAFPFTII